MKYEHHSRAARYSEIVASLEEKGIRVESYDAGGFDYGLLVYHPVSNTRFIAQYLERKWFFRSKGRVVALNRAQRNDAVTALILKLCGGTDVVFASNPNVVEVSQPAFRAERNQLQQLEWYHFGWRKLDDGHSDDVLRHFFRWYESNVALPAGTVETRAARTWEARDVCFMNEEELARAEDQLTMALLSAMRIAISKTLAVFAYDVRHATFQLSTDAPISRAVRNQWAVPILPLENSYYFFTEDFSAGILGDYPANTITVFGEALLAALGSPLPTLMNRLVSDVRWSQPAWSERSGTWTKLGWKVVSEETAKRIRAQFFDQFGGFEDCSEYDPSMTWSLARFFQSEPSDALMMERDLLEKAWTVIRSCCERGMTWHAVQEGNPTCLFRPTDTIKGQDVNDWAVPVIPRIAASRFTSDDASAAIICDNRRSTITVCGAELLDAFQRIRPLILADPIVP